MLRSLVVAAALLTIPVAASAQDPLGLEGTYLGSGEGDLTVELKYLEDDAYAISVETQVPMENDIPGCGGGISGEVLLTAEGGNFFVENEDYDGKAESTPMNQRYCEIGLKFNKDGTLNMEERDGCLYYHGASCGFSGTLIHEGAAG